MKKKRVQILGIPPLRSVEEIAAELQAKWERQAMELPKETRQRFLDLMWAGKTLGEAQQECGIDFDTARTLLSLNIASASYLRRESV